MRIENISQIAAEHNRERILKSIQYAHIICSDKPRAEAIGEIMNMIIEETANESR